MYDKIQLTAIVTTLNEEKNIARCLASLERFDEVIVLDSNSTDKTVDIARSFGVTCIPFTWNGQYPKKRQWALDHLSLKHDRIFFIDADEEATPDLCAEVAALDWSADGYFVRGRYVVDGKVLRFGMQNKKLCLLDRRKMEFPVVDDLDIAGMGEIEGHYQPVSKKGARGFYPALKHVVLHHALEDMGRYKVRHDGYAVWRAEMDQRNAYPQDPVAYRQWLKVLYRRMPAKSFILFAYFYIGRLGVLELKNNIAIYKEKEKYHIHK